MKILLYSFITTVLVVSCNKNNENPKVSFKEASVNLSTHKLSTFSISNNSKYFLVFESGLGDSHSVWNEKNIVEEMSKTCDVLLYDRAGYGNSETGPVPRNIDRLSAELDSVLNLLLSNRKAILIGHSLGGMVIRDYAIKNPDKTAALLFVDPSHEYYNHPSQSDEDMIYNSFSSAYGAKNGATMEARELIEDSQYLETLPDLPNIPVIVITSMKTDASHSSADRKVWFDAHELLKNGITDFTHVITSKSGHYIMRDEPKLIVDHLKLLIAKLPNN